MNNESDALSVEQESPSNDGRDLAFAIWLIGLALTLSVLLVIVLIGSTRLPAGS